LVELPAPDHPGERLPLHEPRVFVRLIALKVGEVLVALAGTGGCQIVEVLQTGCDSGRADNRSRIRVSRVPPRSRCDVPPPWYLVSEDSPQRWVLFTTYSWNASLKYPSDFSP
jgi:hypothetical protein